MEQIEWRRCNDLTTSDYAFLGQLLSLHNINIDFICTFLFPLLYDSPGVFGWLCLQNWNMHHMNTNKYTSVSIYTCHQLNSFYSTVLQQIVKKKQVSILFFSNFHILICAFEKATSIFFAPDYDILSWTYEWHSYPRRLIQAGWQIVISLGILLCAVSLGDDDSSNISQAFPDFLKESVLKSNKNLTLFIHWIICVYFSILWKLGPFVCIFS